MHRSLLLVLALAAPVAAQRTWIIDAAGGMGSHYRTIQQGVDAATPGDVLIVRKGAYATATVKKGVRIIGAPGAAIALGNLEPAFTVTGIKANETFTMHGFVFSTTLGTTQIQVWGCAGGVHFQSVQTTDSVLYAVDVRSSKAVSFNTCDLRGGLKLFDARVAVTSGSINRGASRVALQESAAIQLESSRATLTALAVRGPSSNFFLFLPDTALRARRSTIEILNGSGSSYTAGTNQLTRVSALEADPASTIVIDPAVRLVPANGAPAISGGAKVVVRALPALEAKGGVLGSSTTVEVFQAPNNLFVALLGLPLPFADTPFGTLGLDLRFLGVVGAGTQNATGKTKLVVPHPNNPGLRGLPLGFQAVSGRNGFELTNTVVVPLR